jgi:pyridoxine 5-phosphate synthase
VSLFISPDPEQIEAAARTGAQFIELHTGTYAEEFSAGAGYEEQLERLARGASLAASAGLRINAGHGLSVRNLPPLLARVPHLEELNIGHSLLSLALSVGIERAVKAFLEVMREYRLGPA